MLGPVPPPARELASWDEAVTLSRSRSTDLGTALAEVRRAEAQTRTALAAVLPTINGQVSFPHQFIKKETQVFGDPGAPPRVISAPQSDFFNGNITLSQSVVNLQAWHSIKTAKENEKTMRLSAQDTQRAITLGVATAVVGSSRASGSPSSIASGSGPRSNVASSRPASARWVSVPVSDRNVGNIERAFLPTLGAQSEGLQDRRCRGPRTEGRHPRHRRG